MCSAVLLLPSFITVLMNLVTSVLAYTGSAASSRFGISRLRGIFESCPESRLLLRSLRSVLGATLLTSLNADRIERPAYHVIPNARQVLHAAAANQHQGVFLQVVPHARNVGRHLDAVGQANARHFAQRRVRFLRRLGEDAHADAALLRTDLQRGTFRLRDDLLASLTNELANRRHKRSRVISSRTRPTTLRGQDVLENHPDSVQHEHTAVSVAAGASFQA